MEDLDTILQDLEQAAKVPAKRRGRPVKSTIDKLIPVLYERGALPGELSRLVDLLTSKSHLDQASLGAVIGNLYPSGKIPSTVVLRLVGSLGLGQLKPALTIQALLLKWLVMVYPILEDPAVLSRAYSVLFNKLDTAAYRPQLCQLLALITRRKHVTPYRVQLLLGLVRQTGGGDQSLIGLLRVLKNYYPEIIVGPATRGRASAFKHPDPQWRDRLEHMQREQISPSRQEGAVSTRNGFAVHRDGVNKASTKGTCTLLPTVSTLHAQQDSVTLEEVHCAELLAQNLEKIELPSQLVAVLADPLLQKLMVLRPDPDAETSLRVSHWLNACLQDLVSGDADVTLLLDVAEVIRDYVVSVKNLPPFLLHFFREMLPKWDGKSRRDVVMEALSFTPITLDFDVSYQSTFQLLERAVLDNTAESQLALLSFYTRLLQRWHVALQAAADISGLGAAIDACVDHVSKLSLTLTQTTPTTACFLAILDFYDCVTSIVSDRDLLRQVHIAIPPAALVYIIYFAPSLAALSRLCGVLAAYKGVFEMALGPKAPRPLAAAEREAINGFNGFVMDICNCLLRSRAFSAADARSQACLMSPSVLQALNIYVGRVDKGFALGSMLGLSHSPLLSMLSMAFIRDLEQLDLELEHAEGELSARHAGPVTQSSLIQLGARGGLSLSWNSYRSGLLEYLEAKGVRGIPDLMYMSMKSLRRVQPTE